MESKVKDVVCAGRPWLLHIAALYRLSKRRLAVWERARLWKTLISVWNQLTADESYSQRSLKRKTLTKVWKTPENLPFKIQEDLMFLSFPLSFSNVLHPDGLDLISLSAVCMCQVTKLRRNQREKVI